MRLEPNSIPNHRTKQCITLHFQLTKSVESCHSEVYEVKQDMLTVKSEIDSVQFVKEEIDDIRDSLDRLEAEGERRKAKLADQVL